jgi:putative ABC transport system substrate-binding protein
MDYAWYRSPGISFWVKHVWLVLCVGACLIVPTRAYAEDIAILKSAGIVAYSEAIEAFKHALPASFKVTLEYNLQGDMAIGQSLARRIRASNAHVVLAVGLKAALTAKQEILDIPVIVCLVLNPEKYDIPTSNMVALSLQIPFDQQLKALQKLVPQISRIGVLFDPQNTQGQRDQLEQHARALGLTLVAQEVHSEQEVSNALRSLKSTVEALYLLPDSTVLTENTLDFLISSTLEAHIPLIGFSADLVHSGATTGAYLNYADLGRHAASLVPRLLASTASSILGTMIPPDVIHHSINVKSAQYLGLLLTPDNLRSFNEHY